MSVDRNLFADKGSMSSSIGVRLGSRASILLRRVDPDLPKLQIANGFSIRLAAIETEVQVADKLDQTGNFIGSYNIAHTSCSNQQA